MVTVLGLFQRFQDRVLNDVYKLGFLHGAVLGALFVILISVTFFIYLLTSLGHG